MTREGSGETRPRTDRVMPDRAPTMRSNDVGSGALRRPRTHPLVTGPDRPRGPLPSRVEDTAPLDPLVPAAFEVALEGLDSEVRAALTPEARDRLAGHVRLLLAWNEAMNLTALTDPEGIAVRHLADSLSALPLIRVGPHDSLIDLGSGGGFPGLPLAITLPATHVTLVDSTAKKARFLETVVAALGLGDRVRIRATRAEALAGPAGPRADVVTARAVGSLADLVEVGLPLLGPGGRLIAWKRGDLGAELAAAGRAAAALGGSAPRIVPIGGTILPGHVLVVVRRERRVPPGYPRDPATRKRRPW